MFKQVFNGKEVIQVYVYNVEKKYFRGGLLVNWSSGNEGNLFQSRVFFECIYFVVYRENRKEVVFKNS